MTLQDIFGGRLKMIAAFGSGDDQCAVVESLTPDDLGKCAAAFAKAKPPVLFTAEELARGLDSFPLEFHHIIKTRRVTFGSDLFAGVTVPAEDVRRACEVQARGHLLHLREAYIEAGGDRKAIARLVAASAEPFRALLSHVAELDGIAPADLASRFGLPASDFPAALQAAERLVQYIDTWHRP